MLSFDPSDSWRWGSERAGVNSDLCQLVAAAADLCRKPLKHGVHLLAPSEPERDEPIDCLLRLEARNPDGVRCPEDDLELEIYRSGAELNLMLSWLTQDDLPVLWQGGHAVWMDSNGARCPAPEQGAPMEALARRLRVLLADLS